MLSWVYYTRFAQATTRDSKSYLRIEEKHELCNHCRPHSMKILFDEIFYRISSNIRPRPTLKHCHEFEISSVTHRSRRKNNQVLLTIFSATTWLKPCLNYELNVKVYIQQCLSILSPVLDLKYSSNLIFHSRIATSNKYFNAFCLVTDDNTFNLNTNDFMSFPYFLL